MKSTRLIFALAIIMLINAGCHRKVVIVKTTPATRGLPPGQAKKITGSQSAKAYAPGQQKKKN